MNVFFHKAFDKVFFTVTPDYKIEIADKMVDNVKTDSFRQYLASINGKKIIMPQKFLPDVNFLERHYQAYKLAL